MTILGAAETRVCSLVHNFAFVGAEMVCGIAGERSPKIN